MRVRDGARFSSSGVVLAADESTGLVTGQFVVPALQEFPVHHFPTETNSRFEVSAGINDPSVSVWTGHGWKEVSALDMVAFIHVDNIMLRSEATTDEERALRAFAGNAEPPSGNRVGLVLEIETHIKPRPRGILVRREIRSDQPAISAGGVLLPDVAKFPPRGARVVAVGPDVNEVELGDWVYLRRHSFEEIGDGLLFLNLNEFPLYAKGEFYAA